MLATYLAIIISRHLKTGFRIGAPLVMSCWVQYEK